jgi:predicted RNase H-like nuclease (RuvC/YqgF family)
MDKAHTFAGWGFFVGYCEECCPREFDGSDCMKDHEDDILNENYDDLTGEERDDAWRHTIASLTEKINELEFKISQQDDEINALQETLDYYKGLNGVE